MDGTDSLRKHADPALLTRLLNEAQSIEVLLSDITPLEDDVELYWQFSTDMIGLLHDIEAASEHSADDLMEYPGLDLRRRLSVLESGIFALDQRSPRIDEDVLQQEDEFE